MDAHFPLHVYENIGRGLPAYMHKCLATPPACSHLLRGPIYMDAQLPLHVYKNIGRGFPVYMHKCLATSSACKLSCLHGSVNSHACIQATFPYTCKNVLAMLAGGCRISLPVYMELALPWHVYRKFPIFVACKHGSVTFPACIHFKFLRF